MSQKHIKNIFSVFIIFHLFAIVLYPNPSSVLARELAPYINWYGNSLGLNTTWQFFSPDPGNIRSIEYQVIVEDEDNIKIFNHKWPPDDESLFTNNIGRRFYFSLRTILDSYRREMFFIPYLCQVHPEATSITIKAVQELVSSIEKAKIESLGYDEIDEPMIVPAQEYGCERSADD